MYCIQCGVKLADSEEKCPLCGLEVYHPAVERVRGEGPFPGWKPQPKTMRQGSAVFLLTLLALITVAVTALCDLVTSGRIGWSAYVMGAVAVFYVMVVLPLWFKRPNPVVFVPCSFAAIALYLLQIAIMTGGGWFLPFALPLTGIAALGVTAPVALLRYVKKGGLYIAGGVQIYFGLSMLVKEILLNLTFGFTWGLVWCWYPMAVLVLVGLGLIFLAICQPLQQRLMKKFFI